jgi:hypothetical protein
MIATGPVAVCFFSYFSFYDGRRVGSVSSFHKNKKREKKKWDRGGRLTAGRLCDEKKRGERKRREPQIRNGLQEELLEKVAAAVAATLFVRYHCSF